MSQEKKGALEYLGVYVDEQMIAEMAGSWPAVRIPRADITGIECMRGSESQRPLLQLLVGVVLILMGLYPLVGLIRFLLGGNMAVGHEILLIVWLFLGSWMTYEAVKQRTLLSIRTPTGTKKVTFQGKVDLEELREFLRLMETEFGYSVESSL